MRPTTTKRHLTTVLVREKGLSQALVLQCVNAFFQALREAITSGDRAEIRGFGSWTARETSPRPNARNPSTGERLNVSARRKIGFKVGKILKQALSQPTDSDR